MKSASSRCVFATLVALVLVTQVHAGPKTIEEVAARPDDVAKKVWFGPPASQLKKLADIGKPKRVGLLSFYIYDSGDYKFNSMAATYGGTFFKSVGLTEYAANIFASQFAEMAVPAIKEAFAADGIEILPPIEFMDTQEKVDAYMNFALPKSGLQKATEATLSWVDKSPHVNGAADGYRMIPIHASFLEKKVMYAVDQLMKDLELDAVMSVTTLTWTDSKVVVYSGTTMQLIGPNPEPRPEKESHVKYWWPAIAYPCATFGKGFKGVVFHTMETKKQPAATFNEGYEVIAEAMSARTLAELQKHIDKGK